MDHFPYPMALTNIVQKLKVTEIIRRFASKTLGRKKKKRISSKGVSHGHHVVENGGSVVVRRGLIGLSEVWLFAAFDQQMGDGVVESLQSHLFEKKLQSQLLDGQLNEKQIAREAKEMMRNAYNAATARMQQPHEMGGSASAVVVNGDKIVASDFGGFKAVLCQGGTAIQLGNRRWITDARQWSLNGISALANQIYREKLCGNTTADGEDEDKKRSLVIDSETAGSKTEFIILASHGVWEVMRDQEAVHLIRHIEDAQEAAKLLADEALARMAKSPILCIIIRFM